MAVHAFLDLRNRIARTAQAPGHLAVQHAQIIGGDYRSPEEMAHEPIDEKSDVWPVGANIFGLLTGLFPYYEVWETEPIQELIYDGQKPYIDPRYKTRSYIEGRLVEIMEQTNHPWFVGTQFHPEYRSTVLNPHPLFVAFIKAAKTYSK